MTDAVLGAVAELTALTYLQTFGNRFTNAGVQQLVTLQALESLYLEEETLTVAAFDFAAHLSHLVRLGVQEVNRGPGDLNRLRRCLPGAAHRLRPVPGPTSAVGYPAWPATRRPRAAATITGNFISRSGRIA